MSIRTMLLLVAGGLLVPTPACAVPFLDVIDFDGPGLGPGDEGSISVADNAPPPWLHDILDALGPDALEDITVTDATLTVSYRRTSNSAESWGLVGDGHFLGALSPTNAVIVTTSFILTGEGLDALAGDGQLAVTPRETTTGIDTFRLYESTLAGHYQVVSSRTGTIPEPTTGMLLGLGVWTAWVTRPRLRAMKTL